ncbi:isochorismate synthase [Rhodohalobacter halophilus]|uniref:isochorismate synthase n=1 Tax=Rhodohalobacter halophilus TaxID=1812810 RepID=UPI00083FD49B|nr:isochorismate synthase [Rhodohalobacter halophilus]
MDIDFSDHITPTEFIEALDSPSFTGFLKEIKESKKPILSVTLPIAAIDPLAALELNSEYRQQYYWDHPENDIAIAAAGCIRELKSTGKDRFGEISAQTRSMKNQIEAYTAIKHSMAGPLFLGGYSFSDHNIGKVWKKFGGARFVLPEWLIVKNGQLHLLTLTIDRRNCSPDEIYQVIISRITDFLNLSGRLQDKPLKEPKSSSILCTLQSPEDKQKWVKKVDRARKMISAEKFEKIVLARSVDVESKHKPVFTLLTHKLRQKYPECFNFMIQKDEETAFIGATPERLASFRNQVFMTEGLAGSTSRGKSAIEDEVLAKDLLQSRKDREEHQFVVKAIQENLEPLSEKIENPEMPQIKKLKNVQHLFTPISASIKKGVQIHDLIRELHPTPAVGGFPREEAVSYIHEIEQIDRGWYAAPVGWFNLNGCGEFAVAIRSALLHQNRATLYAGCGIVADSDPDKEWNETLLKFRPMMESLTGSHDYHE